MSTPNLSPIRVLLVEDHALMRAGLRLLLANQPEMTLVGEAATSTEALAVASAVHPDIIVLDLDLGGESALDLMPVLLVVAPQAHVLILTGVRDPALHQHALRLGARGLVRKEHAAEALLQAIVKVHAGEAWLERTMMAQVLDMLGRASRAQQLDPEAAKIATLTARERDIIALIGEGRRNRQIATRLCISETTVRHHLTVIFDKLAVMDRLELVVYAYRHDLVKLPQ
jgi:two-component system, NarL family, nitrate/nitrite response regulator NarL